MKTSYRLFRIKGIDVKVHFTLLILLLLPVMELSAHETIEQGLVHFVYTLSFFVMLFASVLAHELAHSFVAIRNRVKVSQIILWPLGGIASVAMVKDPMKELKISIAGPLASFAIGFILLFLLIATAGLEPIGESILSGGILEVVSIFNFVVLMAYLNIILGAFNLFLPIFPMDGGRVLRAMLGMITDRMTATKLAVRIGQGFLAVFIFFAIMVGSLWLVFIGVFLFIAGLSELKLTELDELVKKTDLTKAMRTSFLAVSPELNVRDLLQIAIPKQSLYPVLDKNGKPLGFVVLEKLDKKTGKVKDVMETKFPAIKLDGKKEGLLTEVYTKGYAFILDKKGALYGILTLQNLQKALEAQAAKNQ